jgi:hypothetical protein
LQRRGFVWLLSPFAAIIGPRLVRWYSNVLTWRAARSKQSAALRAQKLKIQLQDIGVLRQDNTRYLARLSHLAVTALFHLRLLIFVLLWYHELRAYLIFSGECLLLAGVTMFRLLYSYSEFLALSDLDDLDDSYQEQLAKLHDRWGFHSFE